MRELRKLAPLTQREILRGVTLAFYPDAKIGVLGATVDDAALALQTIAGPDPQDATTRDVPVPDYRQALTSLDGVVIGRIMRAAAALEGCRGYGR